MRSRVLGAATFFLSLQLLAATSAHAQGPQPPTPPKAQPPVSSVAHNVITWFHHVTGTGAHRHRIVSSPPLPRPRPAQLEQNKTPAVDPNEAQQPAATAVGPNKMSPTPDTTGEPDKPPAVELNEVQPETVAAEPNKISTATAPTVEPDKVPAELPAASVEQNEAPPRTSAGAVLRGPDIPD